MTTGSVPRARSRRSLRPLGLIVGFYIICFVVLGILDAVAELIGGPRITDSGGALFQWLTLASALIATWVMLRRVEKLPWSSVGLGREALAPRTVITGTVLGGLTIALATLLLFAGHLMRIEPTKQGSWWGQAGQSAFLLLPAAFFEELLMRGYAFSVIRRYAGWRLALIITSIVFGLLHAGNQGADAETILAVTVAGFFLGMLLLATQSLYAAGAAHFAWNWVMAGGFHIAVSGIPSGDVDYRMVETGPDWLTGGQWGPEGGLAAVALMFVAIFYLYGRYLRRMEWKA